MQNYFYSKSEKKKTKKISYLITSNILKACFQSIEGVTSTWSEVIRQEEWVKGGVPSSYEAEFNGWVSWPTRFLLSTWRSSSPSFMLKNLAIDLKLRLRSKWRIGQGWHVARPLALSLGLTPLAAHSHIHPPLCVVLPHLDRYAAKLGSAQVALGFSLLILGSSPLSLGSSIS